MRACAADQCTASVSRAGGYWDGMCRRPVGHDGKHRKVATKADKLALKVVRAVSAFFSGGAA